MTTTNIPQKPPKNQIGEWAQGQLKFIVPPVLAFASLLFIWQLLCAGETPALPHPRNYNLSLGKE
jgi:ABC-type nitrate/sulfonate/bicarbonate transport system permease component